MEGSWSWSSPKQLPGAKRSQRYSVFYVTKDWRSKLFLSFPSCLRVSLFATAKTQQPSYFVPHSFRHHTFQTLGCSQKPHRSSTYRLTGRGWRLIAFLDPSLKDPSSKLRLLSRCFKVPLLTVVTLLSLLLARESKVLGNCFLRSLLSQPLSCTLVVLLQLQPVICRDIFVGQISCFTQSKCSVQDLLFSWASFTCTYPCMLSSRLVYAARAALAFRIQRTLCKQ